MSIVALDIGGANLKAATADGRARSRSFALWKRPSDLRDELRSLLADWLPCDRLAVTMTGELCDCFANRGEGVRHILDAVSGIASNALVWTTHGRFAAIAESLADPLPAASANWLALATYAGRFAPLGSALLIDVGSTTTDVVPITDGRPAPIGRTDMDRLESRELVYTGVRRTPICALMPPGEGMAEFFATTHDVYLALDRIPEDDADCEMADGRPATKKHAAARLARMLGGDVDTVDEASILRFARDIAQRQIDIIASAIRSVYASLSSPVQTVILAGSGSFLARDVLKTIDQQLPECIDLELRLGSETSTAACAYAAATLLKETL
jgi:probable H4MPT-linked C1 transfer pathway protein